jgi:hypothetical protein
MFRAITSRSKHLDEARPASDTDEMLRGGSEVALNPRRRCVVAADNRGGGKTETSDYSAPKAPENRVHVESEAAPTSSTLIPGGGRGAAADVGMSGLDRTTIPSRAVDTGRQRFGNTRTKIDDEQSTS